MSQFGPYRALSFDCYGTLIDWETGLVQSLQPWCAWRGVDLPAEELLELFAANEHEVQSEHPSLRYPDVLAETLRSMAAAFGSEASEGECRELGASVAAWPAFADTAKALRRLKRHYRLIILSNIDRASFAASNRRLGVDFDLVITAEDVGSYKPAPAHFERLLSELGTIGVERAELLHVAQSLFHDHAPAQRLGLPSVWIDRRGDRPGSGATPAAEVEVPDRYHSLADLADAVEAGT
jgi:putative hydrolase of the HAD superfamily